MITVEIWEDVKDFKELYRVSSLGRVRSSFGKILKPSKINSGYLRVDLSKGGKAKHYLIHRLVAFAFIPEVEGKVCINHKNSNREDNRAENLEWCTHKENKIVEYCPQEHEYTKENIYHNTNGGLECLICKRERTRAYRQRKKKFIQTKEGVV